MKVFKAGTYERHFWKKEYEYKSFVPTTINQDIPLHDTQIPVMLEQATTLLGELNERTKSVPDVRAFIQMHVRGEAVSSSAIEGTRTGIEEVVLPEDAVAPKRRDDWREVHNYIDALNWGQRALKRFPVSIRLIRGLHKRLLAGARGAQKQPGVVRTSQNWIGGTSIRTAHFIPPHQEHVPRLLSDWEAYWHNRRIQVPNLIRIAVGHCQFETVHPFLDGNGRVGRLLVILQLIERGMLDEPVLYLSGFFERNRQAYYDSLDRVRTHDDIEGWIRFFLEGVTEAAQRGKDVFVRIKDLRTMHEERISALGRKQPQAHTFLQKLYAAPVVTVAEAAQSLGVHYDTANELVADFERLGIVEEITGQMRNRRYAMKAYIDLFRRSKD